MTNEDHDILVEVRNDLKHLLKDYGETKKKVANHDKIVYGGMGILFVAELISKFWR